MVWCNCYPGATTRTRLWVSAPSLPYLFHTSCRSFLAVTLGARPNTKELAGSNPHIVMSESDYRLLAGSSRRTRSF